MRIECFNSFDALPSEFDELLRSAGRSNFFRGGVWFRTLAAWTLEKHAALRIYGASGDRGEPLGLLIGRSPAGQNGSRLKGKMLGRRSYASLTNFNSVTYAPTLAEGRLGERARILEAIGRQIRSDGYDVIDMNLLPDDPALLADCRAGLRKAGFVVRPYRYAVNCFEEVAGRNAQQFLDSRPSVLRNTLSRKGKKLAKSKRAEFVLHTGSQNLMQRFEHYEAVRAKSWKGTPPFPDFVRNLTKAAAAEEVLRLGILYVDARPVAAQIWIVTGGTATIYKLHFDDDFRDESYGTLLTAHVLTSVINDDAVSEIDFGVFAEQYKKQWLGNERPLWGIVAFNPRSVGATAALAQQLTGEIIERAGRAVKRLLLRTRRA